MLLVGPGIIIDLERASAVSVYVEDETVVLEFNFGGSTEEIEINLHGLFEVDDIEIILSEFEEKKTAISYNLAMWMENSKNLRRVEGVESLYGLIFGVFSCKECEKYREQYMSSIKIQYDINWYLP